MANMDDKFFKRFFGWKGGSELYMYMLRKYLFIYMFTKYDQKIYAKMIIGYLSKTSPPFHPNRAQTRSTTAFELGWTCGWSWVELGGVTPLWFLVYNRQ